MIDRQCTRLYVLVLLPSASVPLVLPLVNSIVRSQTSLRHTHIPLLSSGARVSAAGTQETENAPGPSLSFDGYYGMERWAINCWMLTDICISFLRRHPLRNASPVWRRRRAAGEQQTYSIESGMVMSGGESGMSQTERDRQREREKQKTENIYRSSMLARTSTIHAPLSPSLFNVCDSRLCET